MPTREGGELLAEAEESGKKWATEYLESEHFQDWLAEQLRCGEVPVEDLPETKKQARRIARNILIDLQRDVRNQYDAREIVRFIGGRVADAYRHGWPERFRQEHGFDQADLIDAWQDGVDNVLSSASVRSWLGDEVKLRADECRERSAPSS